MKINDNLYFRIVLEEKRGTWFYLLKDSAAYNTFMDKKREVRLITINLGNLGWDEDIPFEWTVKTINDLFLQEFACSLYRKTRRDLESVCKVKGNYKFCEDFWYSPLGLEVEGVDLCALKESISK